VFLIGSENHLIERAIRALCQAIVGDDNLNRTILEGHGLTGDALLSATRTLPMLAKHRCVLVRRGEATPPAALDALASYLKNPTPSTCLIFAGSTLPSHHRLSQAVEEAIAKGKAVFVQADAFKGSTLRAHINREAKSRHLVLTPEALDLLVEVIGSDLALVEDALERLSLYCLASPSHPAKVDKATVEIVVERVRPETIWKLLDAMLARHPEEALIALDSLLDEGEEGLQILHHLFRQMKINLRFAEAISKGMLPAQAAEQAGAPSFRAGLLAQSLRSADLTKLRGVFYLLSRADRLLKGSRQPARIVLTHVLLDWFRSFQTSAT
ncbi:MAG: DNA polymerase III subunit delta, partial [Sandaracinaceae bacterium]|nr:DNA polymerase III subunit delta [Sandaracinaceae bacterium]